MMEFSSEHVLNWLTQLGLPGLVIVGLVYLGRIWLLRPRQPSQDDLIESMVTAIQGQNNQLILDHTKSLNELSSAVSSLTHAVDELIEKDLIKRVHAVEGCTSDLCLRVSKLEDVHLGVEGVEIVQGPQNYDGYIKGRESGKA